ncbi:MAG: hypothetical protein VKK04_05755 [Synechococcales bacterium]|nr:hypothetical protein [Synechococcales bacterium]
MIKVTRRTTQGSDRPLKWLRWLNLRPEEAGRTFLMFAFYTFSSVGILWLEFSAAALFLGKYGAETLPLIYIASTGMGVSLGFAYSQLQRLLPLRTVVTVVPFLMALPLLILHSSFSPVALGGYTIFLVRLWLEAVYTLNELNTSITANQLFNIREIKRTYPLISSGVLLADILSGFSLPLLRQAIGLENVILAASIMLLIGSGIMAYIGIAYRQAFPNSLRRSRRQDHHPDYTARRLRGPLQRYVLLVITFFVMAQVLLLLVDFQYLSQVEQRLNVQAGEIADFLALFSGTLGVFELITQWFVSSRAIERMGVFRVAMLPPSLILGLNTLTLLGILPVFAGGVMLRFVDELLRYTLVASTAPILFQPIPDDARSRIQEFVRGIAEPIAIGLTGAGLLLTLWLCRWLLADTSPALIQRTQTFVLLALICGFALVWLLAVIRLRSRYTNLLVLSVERGQLSQTEGGMDPGAHRRAMVETLQKTSATESEKQSCIQWLARLDPRSVGDILAPLLPGLSPTLQRESLEVMLDHPKQSHGELVRSLLKQSLDPEAMAAAFRYLWLTEDAPNTAVLQPYLAPDVDATVRSTAAALILRRGNSRQKAEATNALRRMITSKDERERVCGCRALRDVAYLQALRIYIRPLLQDESLRVRFAMLDVIAATQLEEYYPSLVKALYYPSTRDAAMQALARLGNEAMPMLVRLGEDGQKPAVMRSCAWTVISQIGTPEAFDILVDRLMMTWGSERRSLMRTLLQASDEFGIEAVADLLGRRGVNTLIDQELYFMGQLYASLLDLKLDGFAGESLGLLRRSLRYQLTDAVERLFLLMRFLYPSNTIQAAAFNLQSDSSNDVARGLEILDTTVDLSSKKILLTVLDPLRADLEKVQLLDSIIPYSPQSPSQRLRQLLDLRRFLSDWALACCFHLANEARWSVTTDQVLYGLRHSVGFVREAALAYLQMASPTSLQLILPQIQSDPDPLVSAQVHALMGEMGLAVAAKGMPRPELNGRRAQPIA